MIIEVSMKSDTDKMSVSSWWATSPWFAIAALQRQLQVAQTIWPDELRGLVIGTQGRPIPDPPPLPTPTPAVAIEEPDVQVCGAGR